MKVFELTLFIGSGKIIAEGTPEKEAKVKGSYTGHFLKMELGG